MWKRDKTEHRGGEVSLIAVEMREWENQTAHLMVIEELRQESSVLFDTLQRNVPTKLLPPSQGFPQQNIAH